MVLNANLLSLLGEGIFEKVTLPSGESLRLKAPFDIAFSASVLEWFRKMIPSGVEIGGLLGGETSRGSSGEVRVTLTSVIPVRNRSNHPDWEYLPDPRSWTPALRRVVGSIPRRLPLIFHTHPMEETNPIEAVLRQDVNLTVSSADMKSSLELAEVGGVRLQIPQLLIAPRPDPLKGVFAAIYGSEIAGPDLEMHYTRMHFPA